MLLANGFRLEPDKVSKLPGLPGEPQDQEFTVVFQSKTGKPKNSGKIDFPVEYVAKLDLRPGPAVDFALRPGLWPGLRLGLGLRHRLRLRLRLRLLIYPIHCHVSIAVISICCTFCCCCIPARGRGRGRGRGFCGVVCGVPRERGATFRR